MMKNTMGKAISESDFCEEDFSLFKKRLREETELLAMMFQEKGFSFESPRAGFEIEGWITDEFFRPANKCPQLLGRTKNTLVVPEISKFNFEINSMPIDLGAHLLSDLSLHMEDLWEYCQHSAKQLNLKVLGIGTLPTLMEEDLNLSNMTENSRYYALTEQVFKLSKGQPLHFKIEGKKDTIDTVKHDLMFEAAATSLQIHLQVEAEQAAEAYNNSIVLAAPLVALGANSPFFFGQSLWDETRIALFEQAVNVPSFENLDGEMVQRVGLGSGYVQDSLMELFVENLEGFDPLLPVCFDASSKELKHLNFHNGTVWRWVRPIVGVSEKTKPHLRIEQRVPSSGPTLVDMVANVAFYIGTLRYMMSKNLRLYEFIDFSQAKKNFYECAKCSLNANIMWSDGKIHAVKDVLVNEILPWTKKGLLELGCSKKEVESLVDKVLVPRAELARNGSAWQRCFVDKHGKDFHRMLTAYFKKQNSKQPVHTWSLKG